MALLHLGARLPPSVQALALGSRQRFLPVGLWPRVANDLAISEGRAGLVISMPGGCGLGRLCHSALDFQRSA